MGWRLEKAIENRPLRMLLVELQKFGLRLGIKVEGKNWHWVSPHRYSHISVLGVLFYNILTLPGVPLHFVCGQLVRDVARLIARPVRDVARLIRQKSKVFMQMFFDSGIKLKLSFILVEKHFEVQ